MKEPLGTIAAFCDPDAAMPAHLATVPVLLFAVAGALGSQH
ncbi:hypothetical protein [Tropicimonas marinistellae]|nr:hypothetical protein [Tropicimonas marinistellae]